MKVKPTASTGRISALQRLGQTGTSKTNVHQRLGLPTANTAAPAVADARELLRKRQQPIVDARQLLSRPTSTTQIAKTVPTKITIKNDVAKKMPKKVETSAEKQKIVISLVNDQYKKKALSPPPAVIKRPQMKTIATEPISFSSTIVNRQKRLRDEEDEEQEIDRPEPIAKRLSVRKPIKEAEETKRVATNSSTILITNLQASVTEDDVLELFGEIGQIAEIQTLSHGCVQVTYANEDFAKQAISKYHNRLLDGQLMYVSLQPQISYSTKSAKKTTSSTAEPSSSSTSQKLTIDPTFIRQALFNPSTNESNPVRFQVKL